MLCPTMDLIALANDDDQVQVFRMNGEQVFGIAKKRPAAQVTRLNWKPNGKNNWTKEKQKAKAMN